MARRRRQYLYLLPNTLTGLSLFLGFWAIMLVIDGGREALVIAAWWIVIAGLMDGLDGAVARLTKTTSSFGVQFDSLSDLTTFGVAPATLLYAVIFPWHSSVAVGVAATYVIAGAVRLARFNISASQTAKRRLFQGLPIPAAAGLVAAAVLCLPGIEHLVGTEATRRLLPMATLVVAYLMISKIRFLSFRDLTFREDESSFAVTLQVLAFVVFIYWLLFLPRELLALLIFGGYVVYGVSGALVWRLRLVRRPWEQREEHEGKAGR